jgi:hypothetical protein
MMEQTVEVVRNHEGGPAVGWLPTAETLASRVDIIRGERRRGDLERTSREASDGFGQRSLGIRTPKWRPRQWEARSFGSWSFDAEDLEGQPETAKVKGEAVKANDPLRSE